MAVLHFKVEMAERERAREVISKRSMSASDECEGVMEFSLNYGNQKVLKARSTCFTNSPTKFRAARKLYELCWEEL